MLQPRYAALDSIILEAAAETFQAITATWMIYDFIYHISQQVRLSICKK